MKKILAFIIIFLSFSLSVSASSGTVVCTNGDTSLLTVRNSIGGASVGGLSCGTKVEVVNENAGTSNNSNCNMWYQIKTDILNGYACGDYIKIDTEIESEEGKVLCIEDTSPLNIWSDVNKSSKLKSLSCGESLTVLEKDTASNGKCTNWYKVDSAGTTGYACGKYIETASSGSSTPSTNPNIGKSTVGDNIYKKEDYDEPINGDGTIACYEDTGDVSLRREPASGSITGSVSCGEVVTINSISETSGKCGYYYNITNEKGEKGYLCGYFVNTTKLSSTALAYYSTKEGLDEYYDILREKGFPESYLPYLAEIHARHPNWVFEAEIINLDFNDIINNESAYGRNLLEGGYFSKNYFSMDINTYNILTDTFYQYPTEEGWYNASTLAIAFYVDPRNYLNEKYIFAFESLGYSEEHDENTINSLLNNHDFWNMVYQNYEGNVGSDIINSTREVGISSVHIASRVNQEIRGISTIDPRAGGPFTYNGEEKSGFYNFFNIKVYGENKILNGMIHAMNNGWNTPYNGIYGGVSFIYNEYVGINQDTMYYEKFDVSTSDGHYTHQYMQNLAAAMQETNTAFNSYVTVDGYLDKNITFTIPVYNNMSEYAVTSPRLGNPNNYLKDLTVDGKTISGFSYDNYEYEISIPYETESIVIDATRISGTASVNGTGTILNDSDEKKIEIVVTAENTRSRTYTITIKRLPKKEEDTEEEVIVPMDMILNSTGVKYNEGFMFGIEENTSVKGLIDNVLNSGDNVSVTVKDNKGNIKDSNMFVTGDVVTISNSKETKSYSVVIYGDITGNGVIDKDDCLAILRHLNGYVKLEGSFIEAADAKDDGVIDKDDCLAILRHLNGYTNLNK